MTHGSNESAPIQLRKVICFEVPLEEPDAPQYEDVPQVLDDFMADVPRINTDAAPTSVQSTSSIEEAENGGEQQQPRLSDGIPILSASRCWVGVQADVNIMMPDR